MSGSKGRFRACEEADVEEPEDRDHRQQDPGGEGERPGEPGRKRGGQGQHDQRGGRAARRAAARTRPGSPPRAGSGPRARAARATRRERRCARDRGRAVGRGVVAALNRRHGLSVHSSEQGASPRRSNGAGPPVHPGTGGGGHMEQEARAFWLREPGVGEIRPRRRCRSRGRRTCVVRTLRSAVSRGTESLVFGGHVPPSQYDAMRAPFQDGDFPGPVKYGYLSVGRRRGRARPTSAVARSSACTRTRRRTSSRPRRSTAVPDGRARGARGAGRDRRDGGQRAVGRPAPARRPGGRGRRRACSGCCVARLLARVPGDLGDARRRRSGPRRGGAPRSGVGFAAARRRRRAGATWSCTPARPSAGLQRSPGPAGAGGHGRSSSAGTATEPTTLSLGRQLPLRPA